MTQCRKKIRRKAQSAKPAKPSKAAPAAKRGPDPRAMRVPELVELINAAGGKSTDLQIEADIANGAPVNADGAIHLVHCCAWLVKMRSEQK
jgi:hypothetical protein